MNRLRSPIVHVIHHPLRTAAAWFGFGLLLFACGESVPAPAAPPPQAIQSETADDPCRDLTSAEFRSKTDQDTGLGPNGPAMGRTSVRFRGDQVTIQVTDTFRTMRYVCRDGLIMARSDQGDFLGDYDPKTRVLVLAGVEYERLDGPR